MLVAFILMDEERRKLFQMHAGAVVLEEWTTFALDVAKRLLQVMLLFCKILFFLQFPKARSSSSDCFDISCIRCRSNLRLPWPVI
jgi:hypothetical protein